MKEKEEILLYINKNVKTTNDLYYIITVLFRQYIRNVTQDNILKFVDNSSQALPIPECKTKFTDIIDEIAKR